MLKHFWIASGLFPLLSLCAGEQTIAFAPETALSVNGVREIQPVSGMVCNGESRMKFVEESKALNIPATRLYLWVASPGGKLPLEKRVEALLAKRSPEAIAEEFDRNLHVGKAKCLRPSTGSSNSSAPGMPLEMSLFTWRIFIPGAVRIFSRMPNITSTASVRFGNAIRIWRSTG